MLDTNYIGNEGAIALAQTIKYITSLTTLIIGNEQYTQTIVTNFRF